MSRLAAPFSRVRPEVLALRDRVVAMRRDFHQHPELSWREERTQRVILERLRALGLADVHPIARTGATALVRGNGRGPTVLWRADIDALPIPETSGPAYASRNEGVMHACGHDAHTAIALGLAELLAARHQPLAGSVRFVFQPAEEADHGADTCIADGVLEGPHVDRVLGLHVAADVPVGFVNVAPGPFFAAPTYFKLVVEGRGGHAAAPHQAVDAVVVASHLVTALQTVVSRSSAPTDTAVLTVGTLNAGYRWNVIAPTAELTGTVRSYSDRVRELLISRIEEVAAGVCAAFGASFTFEHSTTCPPLVNDPAVTAFVEAQARDFFGAQAIQTTRSMGGDDMAVYLRERPGCYFWLGGRNEMKGIAGRHHDPGFDFDEDALVLGLEFGLRLIEASAG